MEQKNKILSLRAFAKAAGVSVTAIAYHVKHGNLASSDRIVKGIAQSELEKIPLIVKRAPKEKLSTVPS